MDSCVKSCSDLGLCFDKMEPLSENDNYIDVSSTQFLDFAAAAAKDSAVFLSSEAFKASQSSSSSSSSSGPQEHPLEVMAARDASGAESSSRFALRFLLKKSRHVSQKIEVQLSKPAATSLRKFRSVISSLKDSVKSTLSRRLPSSKILSRISSTLKSALRGQKLPECLRFISVSLIKVCEELPSRRSELATFCGPAAAAAAIAASGWQVPTRRARGTTPAQPARDPEFARPKVYSCEFDGCDAFFFNVGLYLRHIRRHAGGLRCDICGRSFSKPEKKRQHQAQCRAKALRARNRELQQVLENLQT